TSCLPGQTVDSCVNYLDNGVHSDATDGRFDYGGGHMQKHASVIGLGALDSASLAVELRSQLGSDVGLAYSQPQPAGGVVSTAADYARFLRKLLGADLKMATMLGSHAVCTNPLTCPAGQAVGTPVPSAESWHYSIGHWVEDDPMVGDGAFSSAGECDLLDRLRAAAQLRDGFVAPHLVLQVLQRRAFVAQLAMQRAGGDMQCVAERVGGREFARALPQQLANPLHQQAVAPVLQHG